MEWCRGLGREQERRGIGLLRSRMVCSAGMSRRRVDRGVGERRGGREMGRGGRRREGGGRIGIVGLRDRPSFNVTRVL